MRNVINLDSRRVTSRFDVATAHFQEGDYTEPSEGGGTPALVVKVWLNGDLTLAHPDIAERVTLPPFGIARCMDQRLAAHEFLQRKMARLESNPQQRVEAHPIMPSPVPPEHKLVEIGLQIPPPKPVVDTQPEPFQVREHAMNPWHKHVSVQLSDNERGMGAIRDIGVGSIPVSPDGAPLRGGTFHEVMKRLPTIVADLREANASGSLAIVEFDRTDNRHFADGAASLSSANGFVLGAIGNGALVDLHNARKLVAIGIDHRLAESVK